MLCAQAWGGSRCFVELICTVPHSVLSVQRKKSMDSIEVLLTARGLSHPFRISAQEVAPPFPRFLREGGLSS